MEPALVDSLNVSFLRTVAMSFKVPWSYVVWAIPIAFAILEAAKRRLTFLKGDWNLLALGIITLTMSIIHFKGLSGEAFGAALIVWLSTFIGWDATKAVMHKIGPAPPA